MFRSLVTLLVVISPLTAAAHGMNPALLELRELPEGRAEVLWRTPSEGEASKLLPVFPSGCRPVSAPQTTVDGMGDSSRYVIDCGVPGLSGQPLSISGLDARADLEVFLRLELRDGQSVVRVLRGEAASIVLPTHRSRLETLRDYLWLGVTHILSGYDHLLFALGLVLLVRSRRRLAAAITAFTVAHSLTLSVATLGWVSFPTRAGEAVIALSIVFLALELARPMGSAATLTQRWPWAMAFGFGLIHGFGFAGALAEVGLPSKDVPLALLGFNLGVEAGQLGCIAVALAVGAVTQRVAPRVVRWAPRRIAYAIGGLATFWFLERTAALFA